MSRSFSVPKQDRFFFIASNNNGTLKHKAVAPIGKPSGKMGENTFRHIMQNDGNTINTPGTILKGARKST